MEMNSLLSLIKNIRISMSISQSAMAEKLGMSTSFYGMLERGNRTLSVEYLFKIAEAFECTPIDLLMMLEKKD